MIKERQPLATASGVRSRLARPGFDRPVEHLHFDRRARVWRSHGDASVDGRHEAAFGFVDDGVQQ